MKNYTLTIGTVCLNEITGLKKTISSVKRLKDSTSQNIQVIVADGGSTDGSAQLAKQSNTVNIYLEGPDRGIYHGMNKILDTATGDFIIFMNAGDYFSPSFSIENVFRYFQKFDMIIGYSCQVYGSDVYIRPRPRKDGPSLKNPAHQAVFISNVFYKKYRYNEQLNIVADVIWMKKIAKHAKKIGVSEIISVFNLGGVSNSANLKHEYRKFLQDRTIKSILNSILKCFIRYILGRKFFYRIIYFFKYGRISSLNARLFRII